MGMDAAGILLQRGASVVVVTAGAYVWQLYQESTFAASPEAVQLQSDFLSQATSASELLWPPTKKSAPLNIFFVLFFAFIVKRIFFSGKQSAEKIRVQAEKRRLLLAQMSMALRWNEDLEEKDDKKEKKKGQEEEEPKKKRPPLAKDLFDMVYDDVEERHVTEYGISADQEPYASTLALFKERLAADFEDAVKFTNLARQQASVSGLVQGADLDADDLKRVAEFLDGTKITELLDLYKKKISKAFGRHIIPKQYVKAAEECKRELAMEQRKGMILLLPILKPLMPLYLFAIVLMIFDSLVGCVTYNGLATLLDGVAAGTMTMIELRWIAAQAYLKLVFCIFAHLSSWAFVGKVTSQFRLKVRNQVMSSMVRQDMKFFDIFQSGLLQERLNSDAEQLASRMFHVPNRLIHLIFLLISVMYTLYSLSPQLFYTILIPIPLASAASYFIIRCMHQMDKRQRKIGEHTAANTMEVIKEIRTVREFAMENEEAEKFAAQSAYRAEIEEYSSALHHIVLISPLICVFDGMRFLCTYLGGWYVSVGTLTVGQAIQAGSLANDLQQIIRDFFHVTPELVQAFQPLARVCDMLNSKPQIEPHPDSPPKLKPESFDGAIEFSNVDFTFPAEPSKQILRNLSFKISPGEKVGFVGATGSGKSTSIKLIERFYEPQAGTITLDGKNIADYDVHHLRRHMSVVAQDNMLFSTTIRENIIYGLPRERRENITDAEIEDACRKANAWVFINEFPRKLETYCGERGVKLSGGQKQRLAIARAIIRKPKIILLDEATSALDSKAEVVVKDALDDMIAQNATGCTIIIAHRLTTVKTCDRIIVMDKGCIKEQGAHEELMKVPIEKGPDGEMLRGWYHDLWQTQHGEENNSERLEALAKENEELRKAAAEMKADALKQKDAEEKEMMRLQEEIARLKLQNLELSHPPQRNLVRASTLPLDTSQEYHGEQQSKVEFAPHHDGPELDIFNLSSNPRSGSGHFW
jgi:ABC-type multidrug transport system fused ATPase/permease subunit